MKVKALLLLLCVSIPLFGGGGSEKSDSTISDAERNEVSADGIAWKKFAGTSLHLGMNKHVYTETIKSVIDEFTSKTGIEIILDEYAQDEFMNKRLVDLSSGAGSFDIVMMDSIAKQAAQAGWIENLTPWFERGDLVDREAYDLADLSPSFTSSVTIDGNLYAIPVSGEKQVLFYRKDIFEEKGLKVPETFDELYETAKILKEEYSAGILVRGQKIHTVSNATGVIWSYGGQIADSSEYNSAVFNSPEGVQGADMFTSLAREFGPPGIGNYTWYECVSDFQQGKAPMFLDMSVFMSQFEDKEKSLVAGKVGYAPMPAGPAGSKPTGGAWSISMSSASKKKEAAFLFMTWITSPEVSQTLALESGLAARASALNAPGLSEKYPADWLAAFQHGLAAEVPELTTFPMISRNEEYLDTIGSAFNSLILEKQDVKTVLDEAAVKVTELFQYK